MMMPSALWFVRPWVAVILTLAAASGCTTVDRWKQEHREANVRRGQVAEDAARQQALKADRTSKLKQAQDIEHLRHLQNELVENSLGPAPASEGNPHVRS